ncbi:mannose-specific lectin-like [Protopterus annectens]|uniref:mannose-specific lectin-like n=1 Tax=Protopterus annectens TaxID=7888 RepID=UPI001CFB4C11|nr:mannose-specific lectin-like [Protopterus annectens]
MCKTCCTTFFSRCICINHLKANGVLNKGESLVSSNGYFRATFQTDGNFVVYTGTGKPLWATGTAGKVDAAKLILQRDNNLVIYTYGGRAIWASNSVRPYHSDCIMVMQDDGNLVIYRTSHATTPIDAIWATGTSQK